MLKNWKRQLKHRSSLDYLNIQRMRVCQSVTMVYLLAVIPTAFSDVELRLIPDGNWRIVGSSYEYRFDGNLYTFTGYSERELTFERVGSAFATSGITIDLEADRPEEPIDTYIRKDDRVVNNVTIRVYTVDEELGMAPMQIWQFELPEEYSAQIWGMDPKELESLAGQLTLRLPVN